MLSFLSNILFIVLEMINGGLIPHILKQALLFDVLDGTDWKALYFEDLAQR